MRNYTTSRTLKVVFGIVAIAEIPFARMHSAFAKAPQQVRIFCYGDSLTAGTCPLIDGLFPYGPHLEEALANKYRAAGSDTVPVVRWIGLPGWTSATMLESIDDGSVGLRSRLKHIANPAPTLAVVLAGTNDLPHGMTAAPAAAERIARSVSGLHEAAHGLGIPTVAVSVPPSGWQAAVPEAALLAAGVNRELRSWCGTVTAMAHFVEFPFGRRGEDDARWARDGLHLTPEGYHDLGDGLAEEIW
eukprot:CAMPEP_0194351436 /NCGR_PEP_ID=MMETSP0171-20130528/108180_1 /TAXON_ID=218684 /ORGANISM="Corethron pennatum, Strain L29A3" /LENGTH=244 /DNA_ID=CAMNT_0039119065 /DNA_START=593 /DNA_END=1324 /DNA_ORIENTATION=-